MILKKLRVIISFLGAIAIIPVLIAIIDTIITRVFPQPILLSGLGWFRFFTASTGLYYFSAASISLMLLPLFFATKAIPTIRGKNPILEYNAFGASLCLPLLIIVFELLDKYDVVVYNNPIAIICLILFGVMSILLSAYIVPALSVVIRDNIPGSIKRAVSATKYVCLIMVIISFLYTLSPRSIKPGYDPNSPNLLVISIDTLRKDHTSFYGYDGIKTPNIDDFLNRSTRFDRAYCSSPWTFPSFSSFLTGFEPSVCGTDHIHYLNENLTTLPEILYEEGYRTECYNNNWSMYPEYGFGRGFDTYTEKDTTVYLLPFRGARFYFHYKRIIRNIQSISGVRYQYGADFISDKTAAALEKSGDRPFFIWVNFFDPHCPYNPPPEFVEGDESSFEDLLRRAAPAYNSPLDDPGLDTEALIKLYDGEIAHVDEEIGRILRTLDESGHRDDTVVVLLSDHGEAFQEHGRWGHGFDVYPELTDMLLAVRDPFQSGRGPVSNKYVSHIDIMPTILDMLGLEIPAGIQGISFYNELTNPGNTSGPVLCEYTMGIFGETKGIRSDGFLFTKDYETGETHLYNIDNDPAAMNDLSGERPEAAAILNDILENRLNENSEFIKRYAVDNEVDLSNSDKANLKALGYLGK